MFYNKQIIFCGLKRPVIQSPVEGWEGRTYWQLMIPTRMQKPYKTLLCEAFLFRARR